MCIQYSERMENIFPTYPSEKGSSEWASFSMIRGDNSNAYPVAGIRMQKKAERNPRLVGQPQFAH